MIRKLSHALVAGLTALTLALAPAVGFAGTSVSPGMSGYEVASRMRSLLGREVRLVALTGYGSPEDQARARAAGFDEHLIKPASIDALCRLLNFQRASVV